MSFDIGNFIGGEKLRVFREKVIVQKANVDDRKYHAVFGSVV